MTKAELAATYHSAPSAQIGQTWPDLRHAMACYARAGEFDIVNDHSGILAAAIGGALETPVVHTVHGPLDRLAGETYQWIARIAPRVGLISLSLNQRAPVPDLPWVANCPNAINLSAYPVHPHRGDYLLFLGRMSPDKGAHRAVEVAEQLRVPLKLAGKMQELREEEFFDAAVRPHLGDGIEYLGEVSHEEKIDLLQNARATLFPIKWSEPFGLVMIESMACGTPVIATRYGAVPEVIDDGRTGIIVDDHSEMPGALERADRIDPLECRRYVEERFSKERMVADYEAAYEKALDRASART
jgi:glycosyltransferase involved in cell wall biosynthesis